MKTQHKKILIKFSILIISLLISSLLCASEKEITIDQGGSTWWLILSTATGKVTVSHPYVYIHLDHIFMEGNPKSEFLPTKIIGFNVGLTTWGQRKGSWSTIRWSNNYFTVDETINAGEIKTFNNIDMRISIEGLDNLQDYWITLQIENQREGESIGYVYAHSKKDVFAPVSGGGENENSETNIK